MNPKQINGLLKIKKAKKFINQLKYIPFLVASIAMLSLVIDFGFDQSTIGQNLLFRIYILAIGTGIISGVGRYFLPGKRPQLKVWIIDGIIILFLSTIILSLIFGWDIVLFSLREYFYLGTFLVFIREFSGLKISFKRQYLNPAQLFILSFVVIILFGTGLLMLPNSVTSKISLIDALFTSTSAVCVTGLIVVDTGTYFTFFGQCIIMILIQLGGIGIMTFTSYFSFFFRGGSTYENQLLLKDMTNSEKIAEVFDTLKKIILLTFAIEVVGALFIYIFLDTKLMPSFTDRLFFSAFHSVSGFCNAGFSTLANSLYETGFRFNYALHLILSILFILGGIGFPIIFNFFTFLKYLMMNRLSFPGLKKQVVYLPWVLNINTRIVLVTTTILIVSGTILFYIFEYNNTLLEHTSYGKLITAFFGAVTPRTAGFNTVDTSVLNHSTILLILLLMWIGASPGSTGGGIKTSTIAIGTWNFLSIAMGKDRIELFRREVAHTSVKRAFAIISLSLAVIGMAVFLLVSLESDKDILDIAFECFSAYSTVGLSLGITPGLSSAGKFVIIITMFIGRVSMLTILIALLRKVKHLKYRYPAEEIIIN